MATKLRYLLRLGNGQNFVGKQAKQILAQFASTQRIPMSVFPTAEPARTISMYETLRKIDPLFRALYVFREQRHCGLSRSYYKMRLLSTGIKKQATPRRKKKSKWYVGNVNAPTIGGILDIPQVVFHQEPTWVPDGNQPQPGQ